MKRATEFIKPPQGFDRFDLSTPQNTKSILTLFSAYQKAATLVPTHNSTTEKEKKRRKFVNIKNTFWMGKQVIHNGITVLVFQFSSASKGFVGPVSIDIDLFLFFSASFAFTHGDEKDSID